MYSTNHIKIPSFSKHASGQAVVRLNGKDCYLGRYGTPAARQAYDRLIQEWLAHGRLLPGPEPSLTINELILAYWKRCEQHYRNPAGEPTSELHLVRLALRPLKNLYGKTVAAEFGPLALKAVRQRMIASGLVRGSINKHVGRIKQMFRWGVENELIPLSIYHGLQAVVGLQRGRTEARETEPVRPVNLAMVQAIKPFVAAQVCALMDLQLLTGMRPGEACGLRACDIDMTGPIWIYRPQIHKTMHHGHTREIFLGPQAQAILKPFLRLDTHGYLFSPCEAREERFRNMRVNRKTKVQPSQLDRRKRKPKRLPGQSYTVGAYCRAIKYGCERAFPLPEDLAPGAGETKKTWLGRLTPDEKAAVRAWRKEHSWHPHQLRHNAATSLRKQFGVELARIVLGHKTAFTTEIYAEADRQQAMEAIAKVG